MVHFTLTGFNKCSHYLHVSRTNVHTIIIPRFSIYFYIHFFAILPVQNCLIQSCCCCHCFITWLWQMVMKWWEESVTVALTLHNDEFVVVQLSGLSGRGARLSSINKNKSDKNVWHCDKSAVLGPFFFFFFFFFFFLSCHWPGKIPNEGWRCRALSW